MTFCSAAIFDMDGVLVDVRESYVYAALNTVRALTKFSAYTSQDFHRIKGWGGFNNDWDLTMALLWLQASGVRISAGGGPALGGQETDAPKGLRAAVLHDSPFRRQWADKVQDLFQQFYLGAAHYERIYGKPATVVLPNDLGFIAREKPWIPADHIHRLPRDVYRILLTGRPRPEAEITLDLLGLRSAFHLTVTDTESLELSRKVGLPDHAFRKPSALLAKWLGAQLPISVRYLVYWGDTRDDLRVSRCFAKPCQFFRCAFEDPSPWQPGLAGVTVYDMADLARIF